MFALFNKEILHLLSPPRLQSRTSDIIKTFNILHAVWCILKHCLDPIVSLYNFKPPCYWVHDFDWSDVDFFFYTEQTVLSAIYINSHFLIHYFLGKCACFLIKIFFHVCISWNHTACVHSPCVHVWWCV